METAQAIATTIGSFALVGAFVDFYIGKLGQKRIRDLLETWWLRLSYVSLRNLAKEEARYCYECLEPVVGKSVLSIRRYITIFLCQAVIFLYAISFDLDGMINDHLLVLYLHHPFLSAIRASIGLSITLLAAHYVSKIKSTSFSLSVALLLSLVVFQILIISSGNVTLGFSDDSTAVSQAQVYMPWYHEIMFHLMSFLHLLGISPRFAVVVSEAILEIFVYPLAVVGSLENSLVATDQFYLNFKHGISICSDLLLSSTYGYMDRFSLPAATICVEAAFGWLRLAVFILFMFCLVIYPIHSFLMTIWLRLAESDKPTFTLLFGGMAAFAKGVQELTRLL